MTHTQLLEETVPGGALAPSAVRELLLREHEAIRARLARVERTLERLIEFGESARPLLCAELMALHDELWRHLDHEEEILLPALVDADPWGPERVELVRQDHADQRELLLALERWARGGEPRERLARFVVELATLLRRDMASEERISLTPELLRDDVVVVRIEAE